MFKKVEKNYINVILNKIKIDLLNYILYINSNLKIYKNNPDIEDLVISIQSCIQNIFFKIRNYICKLDFTNYQNFKIFNFYYQKIKNKINKFLEDLKNFIFENNNTLENIENKKIEMSNFCYNQTYILVESINS